MNIETLTISDIDAAMQLVEAAGWNQVPADWQRVIEFQPHACFKATVGNRLVGTVTSTSYGLDLAWIGMMLVDPALRRQGVGRALMQQVVAVLQTTGDETIKLDATPAGRPLYEQLGFVAQFDFQRWCRKASPYPTPLELAKFEQLANHYPMDSAAFGVDRQRWLSRLAETSRLLVEPSGFGMLRCGRIADYLGPVVSNEPPIAHNLIARLAASTTASVYWDIPRQDASLFDWAKQLGFEPVRVLTRMVLKSDKTHPNLQWQYAICDPATG